MTPATLDRHRVVATATLAIVSLTIVVLVVDGPLPGEVGFIRSFQELGEPVPTLADLVGATTGTEGNLVVGGIASIWLVRRRGRAALAAIAVCLLAMLVVQPVAKQLVDRDRPTEAEVEIRTDHESRSYPSGHSLSTATVWGLASGTAGRSGRRRLAGVLAVPIAATALASTVHGAHWASDIVAGTIIGLAAAGVAQVVLDRDRSPLRAPR